ncbi:MAG: SDR family NAD(P)-dependent oxidoreductase [Solirubrobacterales bacterium]
MDETPLITDERSRRYLEELTLKLAAANDRIAEVERRSSEPIAIVGMSCRYPGRISNPDELWSFVSQGRDGICGFPEDRGWDVGSLFDPEPGRPGKSYVRAGGFMDGAADFDADFFGISPKEALVTDPQQRIWLEGAWEALEAAGIRPETLRQSKTGVFAGVMYQDYGPAPGMSQSIVSGRVAYALGLVGQAVSVDTACSGSLVATHLACRALRSEECELALAGGVTVLSTPGMFVEFSRQRGLAHDGRCKPFADAADGVALSEGMGVLALERLGDAQAAGHEVLAVIRGSAVNQDGASNGLTAPNGPSQELVIAEALADAGLAAADVDVVEAHGTGTTLGDPIEAEALLAAYGADREGRGPLRIGSIKSNIGHTQAAAGVAGVIKMVQALRSEELPPTINLDRPSRHVDWAAGEVELLGEAVAWPRVEGRRRRAGVSSFGIAGTNAHLILEEAPDQGPGPVTPAAPSPLPGALALPLSAKSAPALREMAAGLAAHLRARPELEQEDVSWSLATGRPLLDHRAVIGGADREELLARLDEFGDGDAPGLAGTAGESRTPVFLFTGQGAQRAGMGLELQVASSVFAEAFEEICAEFDQLLPRPLAVVIEEGGEALDDTAFAQPALFAVEVALARLVEAAGMRPAALIGHSIGELVAAHLAGVLSLEDACALVAARGRLMGGLPAGGAMVAIEAAEPEVRSELASRPGIGIAAVNGPRMVVVSGTEGEVLAAQAHFDAAGRRTTRLAVSHAFHSPLIGPMLDEFGEVVRGLGLRAPKLPIISTLTGAILSEGEACDPAYWVRQARDTVRFADAVSGAAGLGHRVFVELGPDPALCVAGSSVVEEDDVRFIATLREGREEPAAILDSLASAHRAGVEVDWAALVPGASRVPLPTYPFRRERFWLASGDQGDPAAVGQASVDHALLGASVELPDDGGFLLTGRISLAEHPWLVDHAVLGSAVLPSTALLDLALRAGEEAGTGAVDELIMQSPVVLPEEGALAIQVQVGAAGEDGARPLTISSRPDAEGAGWTRHASGRLTAAAPAGGAFKGPWPPEGAEALVVEQAYERLAAAGFDYGPAFRCLTGAWRRGDEVFAEVALDHEQEEAGGFGVHPALLDAAFHAALLAASEEDASAPPRVPFSYSDVSCHAVGATALRVRVAPGPDAQVSLVAFDAGGARAVTVGSLATRQLDPALLRAGGQGESLFVLDWVDAPTTRSEPAVSIAILDGARPGPEIDLPGLERHPDLDSLLASPGDEPAPDLVLLPLRGGDVAGPDQAHEMVTGLLTTVQTFLASGRLAGSRLVVLSGQAVSTSSFERADPGVSAALGLLGSAAAEHPGRFACLDLAADSVEALPAALAATATESRLALRGGRLLAPRLRPSTPSALDPEDGTPRHLGVARRGTLDGLEWLPSPAATAPLTGAQVRVSVRAAGLNFRDVLLALDMYPGEVPIGGEAAGVVIETGPDAEGLAVGDLVMGLMADAFSTVAVSDVRALTRLPRGWSFAEGASVPIAFLTAWYGLRDLAGLEQGESVLVHAGAGGVGTAAIQIARLIGARVFATASPWKWPALIEAGVAPEDIASSRDLGFVEQFREATTGRGVDVVLNSLAGGFVDASAALLADGGRFLEIGKTDIRDPADLGGVDHAVTYLPFDMAEAGLGRIGKILDEVSSLAEGGRIHAPTIQHADLDRPQDAFRHLREGRNVGKVVFDLPATCDPERTVLVTGAPGGLGSEVARHLAEGGARRLMLASRRGPDAEGAADLRADLAALGAEVEIVACDVADRKEVDALVGSVDPDHPLGTVVHCAGLLDDGLIEDLDRGRLDRVMAPKVDGAWNLHEATAGIELERFILFSSLAGVMGGAGQGNYAAANAYLDALARLRRTSGLPATSIAWGLWEAGMGEGLSDHDRARIARAGLAPMAVEEGLAMLDRALASPAAFLVATPTDRAALRRLASADLLPPLLRDVAGVPCRAAAPRRGVLADRLAGVPEGGREALVAEIVREQVAAVLGHGTAEAVDPDRAFKDLGFDSLAAVELRNRLGAATGLELPVGLAFDHPTVTALSGHLLGAVTEAGPRAPIPVAAGVGSDEPIAIVGMACRYPGGVDSPAALWRLAAGRVDAVGPFPTDRGWDLDALYDPDPDHPGTSYAREGGFLADAAYFDADFFGISPREALAMDPQQRLLLEAAWEALEHAGIDPELLRGRPAGVFAGAIQPQYAVGAAIPAELEGYLSTGTTTSVISGRVAYALGLTGPAVTVDTACSSSLVAMHIAAGSLRSGECDFALAGGATVMATPSLFTEFSRQRGIAADGRSKSFAAGADGVGWSEGVGWVALERLSDARSHGHRVLATIRGSAINQDGASNGLTAPNRPAQEAVIRQALANAHLGPADVDAVEAHGTGTTLGDPIEAEALLAVYGAGRRDMPLRLGSIKSNIGHTQAAAGVAGVIKIVEALDHERLPATIHLDEPTPHVDWSRGEVELLAEEAPWPRVEGRPRRAGVSSFGISGTNAHLIIEEAPGTAAASVAEAKDPSPLPGALGLPLSAKAEPALREMAAGLARVLRDDPGLDPADVAFTLATTRSRLDRRAVVTGTGREELLAGLEASGSGRGDVGAGRSQGPVFLLTGQGAQRSGMGSALRDASPVFAAAFDEICGVFDPHLPRPLPEVIEEGGEALDDTTFAQPALFATEVAIARLLGALGIRPAAMIGHSVGELAAAHLAGVLSLGDACALVAARGRLMGELPEGGAMMAIEAGEAEVVAALGDEGDVEIAAVNGPSAVVVSGEETAVLAVGAGFETAGRRTRRLAVSHAFHSPLVDPMLEELGKIVRGLDLAPPRTPIVSTVTGMQLSDEEATDPDYWVGQARLKVRFADAVASAAEIGAGAFVELGPDPALCAMASGQLDAEVALIPTLREGRPEPEAVLDALAAAYLAGAEVDWSALTPGASRVPLSTYPFQRRRFWLPSGSGPGDPADLGQADAAHPLLGAMVELPDEEGWLLTGRVSLASHPWLADHVVMDTTLLPGTGLLELALRAGQQAGLGTLRELTLGAPMVFPETGDVAVQVWVGPAGGGGTRPVTISSRFPTEEGEWVANATGTLAADPVAAPEPVPWPPVGAEPIPLVDIYDRLAAAGYDYGPMFRRLRAAWRGADGGLLVEAALDDGEAPGGFAIHPVLLDAAFHPVLLDQVGQGEENRVPFSWERVTLHSSDARVLRCTIGRSGERVSLVAGDETGAPVVSVDGLVTREVDAAMLRAPGAGSRLHALGWEEVTPATLGSSRVALVGEADPSFALPGLERHPDLDSLLGSLRDDEAPDLVLLPLGAGPVEASCTAVADLLVAVQRFLMSGAPAGSRLVVLTCGAASTTASEHPDPVLAAALGLLGSAASEHPGRFACLDLDRNSAAALPGALAATAEEPRLALREGRLLAPRLHPAGSSDTEPSPLDPERSVLITGALGALGSLVARHLAGAGVGRLILVSRRGAEAEGAAELRAGLEALGATVEIHACDVADRPAVEALVGGIDPDHPLGTVVHCAGLLDDGLIETLDRGRLDRVMAPKALGAWNLHRATADLDLERFVLFSSVAGILAGAGQGNYAAANAFLDSLAGLRQAEGRPATSIAWGLWDQESGMIPDGLAEADRLRRVEQIRSRLAIGPLSPEDGLALLDLCLDRPEALLFAAAPDQAALRAHAAIGTVPAVLRDLVRASRRPAAAPQGDLAARLADVPEAGREAVVAALVHEHVAAVLGHSSAEAVDPERPFRDLGFDSLAAVELRNRLGAATGLRLAPTLVFDHPTASAVAAHLQELVGGREAGETSSLVERFELECARLETLIGEAGAGEELGALTARLRSVLSTVGGDVVGPDLGDLSDEEMFARVDGALGVGSDG